MITKHAFFEMLTANAQHISNGSTVFITQRHTVGMNNPDKPNLYLSSHRTEEKARQAADKYKAWLAEWRAAQAAQETAPAQDVEPLTRYDLEQAATDSDTPAEDAAKQEALRTFDASHPAGTTARLAISCLDYVGREGSFLYIERNGERVAVSPIFASVLGVFDWCAAHGWTGDDRADVFTKGEPAALPTTDPAKLAELYRDWVNNWITLDAFARYHGITEPQARAVIDAGRVEHERQALPVKLENVTAHTPAMGMHLPGAHVYPAGQAPQDAKYSIKVTPGSAPNTLRANGWTGDDRADVFMKGDTVSKAGPGPAPGTPGSALPGCHHGRGLSCPTCYPSAQRPQYGSHHEIVQERLKQLAPQVKPYEMRRVTITGYDRVNLYLDGDKVGTITATPSTVWNGRPKDDPSVVTLNGKRWEFDTETAAIEFARAQLEVIVRAEDDVQAMTRDQNMIDALGYIARAVDALMCIDHDRYPGTRAVIMKLEAIQELFTSRPENDSTKC